MDELDAPLSSRLPARDAALLESELGLASIRDLLWHLPRRYVERGQLSSLRELQPGESVTVVAEVASVSAPRTMRARKGALLNATVGDGRDVVALTFFAAHPGQLNRHVAELVVGRRVLVSGKVEVFNGSFQLARPDYQPLDGGSDAAELADRPTPLYPATGRAPSWKVAKAVRTVLDTTAEITDVLPADVVRREGLLSPLAALRAVHDPRTKADVAAGQRRMRYEEAFVLQTALAQRRASVAGERAVARAPRGDGLLAAFDARLPFELTDGQRAVGEEIAADLAREHPMQRLLQGDVGSGKTLVALRAMLAVVDAGGQAALLAPTEVLAAQHLRSITAVLGDLALGDRALGGLLGGTDLATRVVLLTGSMGAAARREALLAAAGGAAGIVVGTHALLQEHVQFAELGLVVVDEQHRFGVEQRDALRGKASSVPHLLVMTATPIPRTVAMTVFGDLETSVLRDMPPGRAPVTTVAVPLDKPAWVDRVWGRVAEEAALGRQTYVVCARIDAGDAAGVGEDDGGGDEPPPEPPASGREKRRPAAAVSEVVERVRAHPATAGLRTEVLHGRLLPAEKEEVMRRFAAGEVDVLVATTVVEVGVDVPNASVMVVVDADRFGISQLHQLRGRIGRGGLPGTCLLLTEVGPGSPAGQRIQALVDTTDGFELARTDLEQRREGDVLGAAQSGRRSSLKLLGVLADADVIATARRDATHLVADDPHLARHTALAAAVADRVTGETERFLERA